MNLINYKIIELSELKFSLYKVQKFWFCRNPLFFF